VRPNFDTILRAKKGDPEAQQQVRIYALHRQAKREGAAQASQLEQSVYDPYLRRLANGAYKTGNPTAGALIAAMSPSTALTGVYRDARSGNVGLAALQAALLAGSVVGMGAPSTGLLSALRSGRTLATSFSLRTWTVGHRKRPRYDWDAPISVQSVALRKRAPGSRGDVRRSVLGRRLDQGFRRQTRQRKSRLAGISAVSASRPPARPCS
jgi:hypothetical protein